MSRRLCGESRPDAMVGAGRGVYSGDAGSVEETDMSSIAIPPITKERADEWDDERETLADLLEALGGIPPERVLRHPTPGTATEADVIAALEAPRKRLCELIDGTLVEKPMGFRESVYGNELSRLLANFVKERKLGLLAGADGTIRMRPGRVRIPDVAFYSWARLPNGVPDEPIPQVAPNLAVEVLSKSNTPREMQQKLKDYFAAGVELVWLIDPVSRTVEVHTPSGVQRLTSSDTLDGGSVLPGFRVPVNEIFSP